jgi:NDP-sugar pyrophosphorylase family protein
MKFAVIAAGDGSRLGREGVAVSKPLVTLNGEPMLDRLVRLFTDAGASEVVMIVNERMPDVVAHVRAMEEERRTTACPLRLKVAGTPSSMHSFHAISAWLTDGPFCLTTVDTVCRPEEFKAYVQAFMESDADGFMAVTDYVDDERPLYVGTDGALNITGFYDEPHGCRYVSGGMYCLTPAAIGTLRRCVAEGQSRMRNFQRQLVKDGLKLKAWPFSKVLDVDHAADIVKAEQFISEIR